MSINLTVGATSVALHPDLLWVDEFDWHPVEQSVERSVRGALIVQVNARLAGRPITLEPADDDSAWMTRSVVEQLRNWAAVPGQSMTLTIRGADRTVMFRHQDGAAFEAEPVVHFSDAQATDYYRCTLRLVET